MLTALTESTLPAKNKVRNKSRPANVCFSATATISAKPIFNTIVMAVNVNVTFTVFHHTLSLMSAVKLDSPMNFCCASGNMIFQSYRLMRKLENTGQARKIANTIRCGRMNR